MRLLRKILWLSELLQKKPIEIVELWDAERPHFGGTGDHRFENGECVYCGRPESWDPKAPRIGDK